MEHRGLRAAGLDTGPVRVRVCPAARSLMPAFAIPLRVRSHTGGCSLPAPGRPCWPPALPLHRLSTQSQPSAVPSLWPHNSDSGQSACVGPASQTGPLPTHVRPAPHWPRTLVPRPITEVLCCGHPPLPETHSACTRCPGPVLGEPRAVLLTGSDSVRPCSLTAPITALRKCEHGICAASRTHIREAEQFRPNDARTVPGTQRVASTALTEAGSDPDNQRILWVSRSHYCLSPNFPCQLNANRPPPILSSARLGPTEMYLVNKVLKYLKVF